MMRKSQEFEETETEGTERATPLKLEGAGPTQGTEIAKLSKGRERREVTGSGGRATGSLVRVWVLL